MSPESSPSSEPGALTPDQLAELKSLLLDALEKLQRSMAVTDEAAKPVELEPKAVGRLSRIDSLQNQALSSNLQDRERARLAGILAALERIEEGDYGSCIECGGTIEYGRLLVFPEATTCTGCAD